MKRFMTILLAMLALAVSADAQRNNNRGDRKERNEKRAKQMVKALELDDATAEWFKPIYAELQDTLRATQREAIKMKSDTSKDEKLTDEQAGHLLNARFAAEEKAVALKRTYCVLLSERLTPRQLLKLFSTLGNTPARQSTQGNGFPGGPGPGFPPPGGFHGGF